MIARYASAARYARRQASNGKQALQSDDNEADAQMEELFGGQQSG